MIGHDEHCKKWIEKLFLLDIDSLLSPKIDTINRVKSSRPDAEWDSIRGYETVFFG